NSGFSETVNFSGYTNGPLPPIFTTVFQTGAGATSVSNGAAILTPSGSANSAALVFYNAAPTQTPYQIVSVVFSAPPQGSLVVGSAGYLIGRANSAGTSYVLAEIALDAVALAFSVAGTLTTVATATVSYVAGAIYQLVCGISGSEYTYEILRNGSVILSYVDSAHASQVGSAYQYAGFALACYYNNGFSASPAVLQWAVADNAPPTLVGSGARIYRASTTQVTPTYTAGSITLLPSSFFDTLDKNTPDITVSLTNGEFTVANAGWYKVTFGIEISGGTQGSIAITLVGVLYHNGSAAQWGNGAMVAYYAPLSFTPTRLWSTFDIYLSAGDSVQVGYVNDGGATPNTYKFLGEATGQKTFLDIALMNRSLA
ncbi:MAG: hypothetical protein J2P17_18115, partial [Mycobacterium sp.]|nr:hypothetical protein [Mycobacterium sp.]